MPLPVKLRLSNPPPASARANEVLRAELESPVAVSSESAARLLGLVAEVAADDRPIGLDVIGHASALPLLTASDSSPANPFQLPDYSGPTRVCAAWQLVEAFRQLKPIKAPLTIAILDGGFWLDGKVPGVALGQAGSDFGTSVFQLNLLDRNVGAGGASPNKCSDEYTCPWHGNAVASVAAARVGNGMGAAGVGGTVARPVLLKTDLSIFQVIEGVQVCLDWGIDVLNISFSIEADAEIWFPTKAWNHAFQFAANKGLIIVASAGNRSKNLPDDANPRPATRTPGTITVGALDAGALDSNNNVTNYQARSDSNFGDSVNIWAPGTGLPVMPDPNNLGGSLQSGTSMAAPFVSGVLAMMRAVNPSIDNTQARQLLIDSGWKGSGKVNVGVDAFAAVLAAMGGRLPEDEGVPNNSPGTASKLRMISGGRLVPYAPGKSFAFLSHGADQDWYKFDVEEFSRFDLQMNWYSLLGSVSVSLEPDDPFSQALGELSETSVPGSTRLVGLLAPGGYKLHVRGSLNLYELTVDLARAPLTPDQFEPNNTFESATRFRVADPPKPGEVVVDATAQAPGTFDLTLHTLGDRDFFRIEVGSHENPLHVPVVRVARSDAPLDVAVFDAERRPLDRLVGKRDGHLTLPSAASPFFFVEISAPSETRYVLTIRFEVDQAHLPGPHQNEGVFDIPDPGDPPFRIDDGMDHVLFQVDDARRAAGNLILASVEGYPIRVDVLDSTGAFVTAAVPGGDSLHQSVELDVGTLQSGTYVLRLSRAGAQGSPGAGKLNVEVLPTLH